MLLREMSREECDDLLRRLGYGHLACAHDNQPYVVPIYFVSDRGHLYGFSTKGQKIEWMRLNPRVCVEADEVQRRARLLEYLQRGHRRSLKLQLLADQFPGEWAISHATRCAEAGGDAGGAALRRTLVRLGG